MIRFTARDAALYALKDVEENSAYASQAIDRQLQKAQLSPEDRRLAVNIFYSTAENCLYIDYILSPFFRAMPDSVVRDILRIAVAQLLYMDRVPDHAVVDEAVKQTRNLGHGNASGFVNGILRNFLRQRAAGQARELPKNADERMSVKNSISIDAVRRLIDAYGEDEAEKICAYKPASRTQTVRPNLISSSDAELEKYLTDKNISWTRGIVPHSYICKNAGALAMQDGYRKGMFSIQGESAMLAAYAMQVKPAMNILDACAAPGGKSALMCEMMNGTGRVYAWDVHEHRVELIRSAGRRLKLYNLRPSVKDARTPMESFERFMDAVLVDAPCSGLGVMSDKPDIRARFTNKEVEELIPIQRDILSRCSEFVKLNGLLVYSTCTILPEENEKQVEGFLKTHPEFALDKDSSWLPEDLKGAFNDGMVTLLPHRDGVEGFFIARMRRKCL